MVRQVVTSLILTMTLALTVACTAGGGGGGGGGGSGPKDDDPEKTGGTTNLTCAASDGSALPEVPQGSLTTGTLVISVPHHIDPTSVKAQVVDHPDLRIK